MHGFGELEDCELPCDDEGHERAGDDSHPLADDESLRNTARLFLQLRNVLGVVNLVQGSGGR